MQLHVINNGFFKLDGGAMFGVVPKSIWNKLNPADENNMCTWATRSLLVQNGNTLTLIDTGIGNKQNAKFLTHYYLHGKESLLGSIAKAGYTPADVTDVFLTHLHFDHVGGAVSRMGEKLIPTFPNARYWSNTSQWDWAVSPNPREKASFLKENIVPLQESGQLLFTNSSQAPLDFLCVDGHTEKMMLPKIEYKGKTLVFVSDLIPSVGHIPLPYLMAYDVRPLVTMQEKKEFLHAAAIDKWVLIFQHDPKHECCTVKFSEKGVVVDEIFPLCTLD
jgi:glyoxylase-like metal-dependent hydrolase (beta-lactamase superfamily II)